MPGIPQAREGSVDSIGGNNLATFYTSFPKKFVSEGKPWHFVRVKTILSKPASSSTAADVEVRQLQATGKRIAADKKSILRILAATGMYTAAGKLKPQFR